MQLDPFRGTRVVARTQFLGGAFLVARQAAGQHIAGAKMEAGMLHLHLLELAQISETLAARAVYPHTQRALVIARDDIDLQLFFVVVVDATLKADLPLHVRIDGGFEVEAGDDAGFQVVHLCRRGYRRDCLCRGRTRIDVFTTGDCLEPVHQSHLVSSRSNDARYLWEPRKPRHSGAGRNPVLWVAGRPFSNVLR